MKRYITIVHTAGLMVALSLPAAAQKPTGNQSSVLPPGAPATALAHPADSTLVSNVRNALSKEFHRGVVIGVSCTGAVVTLAGQVSDQAIKLKAGQIAQHVLGVQSVVNLLTLPYRTEPVNTDFMHDNADKLGDALGGDPESDDGNGQSITPGQPNQFQSSPSTNPMPMINNADLSLAAAVVKALGQQMGQSASVIHVTCSKAVITLTGNVNGVGPKTQAEQIAKSVSGVKGVVNLLQSSGQTISPGRSQASPGGSNGTAWTPRQYAVGGDQGTVTGGKADSARGEPR
jgi:osmotically-inducible protein OsmY